MKVLCHGVFDVLHAGHLAYFRAAKKFGDHLTVSVTADKYVSKGPGRPYFSAGQRAEMVKALGIVDDVIISDSPTAVGVIEQVRPAYYVKGPDYKDLSKDVTGEIYNEKAAVEQFGGELVFTDETTFSSSTLINRFLAPWTDEQKACIETVQSLGGIRAVERAIEEIGRLNVLVVGEPIMDIYRFVRPEGISSKSPSISARLESEEVYQGGAIAIKNHLRGFAKEVHSHYGDRLAKKTRYLSGSQRIFEVTEIDDKPQPSEFFCDKMLELAKKSDVAVVADFGHGLFDKLALAALQDIECFMGLNAQTNSSNFGFNPFTRHQRYDYLCLDLREARLAIHDRTSLPKIIFSKIDHNPKLRTTAMTTGPGGALFSHKGHWFDTPAFADNVVDAIGAGDAFFAITTCLLKTDCPAALVPFIGNVFAGLKTKIIGNKSSVSKAMLLKACEGILK